MDFLETVLNVGHEQHPDMIRWDSGSFDPTGSRCVASSFRLARISSLRMY